MNWLQKFFKVFTLAILLNLILGVAQSFADAVTYQEVYTHGVNGVTGLQGISDVAVSPDGKFVYTASYQSSAVSVFERNPETGQLTYRSTKTGLSAAFSVDVSADNKNVYVASPTGSVVIALARDITTGELTETNRLGGSPTGGFVSVSTSPDAKAVYGIGGSPSGLVVFNSNADTGSISRLADYADNVDGNALGQVFSPTGSPIKNIASSADGNFVYVTSTTDNAVSLFSRDTTTGALTLVSVYTDNVASVDGLQAASSAKLSPDGKNLYVTGQGESSVAIFSVDSTSGELTYLAKVTHGVDGVTNMQGARSLAISPDGKYVLVSAISSSSVTAFLRDSTTGLLTFDSEVVNSVDGVTNFSAPSGMSTDPLNRHLYVAAQNSASLVVFSLPTPAVSLSVTSQSAVVSGAAVVLDNQLAVLDSDSLDLVSAQVSISSGFITTDTLAVQTVAGIFASYDASTGVLSLSGVATLADYQTVLRSLTYQAGADPTLNNGDTSERTISIVVSDGDNSSAVSSVVVTVTAEQSTLFTVAFVDWDNTVLSTQQVDAGAAAVAPASPTRTGYSFTGWNVPFDNITSSLTVQAQYSINSYTITFDTAGGSAVAPVSANFGAAVTAPAAPTREGYTFAGWTPAVPAVMPAANTTVTAQWTVNQYQVIAQLTGEGAISPAAQQVEYGKTATFGLTLAEEDAIVNIGGSCGAVRSGNNIVTAAITTNCGVQISVYPASNIEGDVSTPVSSGSVLEFAITGGAGEKELIAATVTRADIETELALAEVEALLHKTEDGKYQFIAERTGQYELTFQDVVSGEHMDVELAILPYLAFAGGAQPVTAGSTATVRIWLSDEPAFYPVTVRLSGDGAEAKTISLTAADLRQQEYLVAVSAETIVSLDEVQNALAGTPAQHQLQLQNEPVALALQVVASQQGEETVVISQDNSDVTVSVTVLNGVAETFSWSSESLDIAAEGDVLVFTPVNMATGVHDLRVTASNNDGQEGSYVLTLQLISHCDLGNCYTKTGLPESANPFTNKPQRLPICPVGDNVRAEQCLVAAQNGYIEVGDLYQLTLGEWSLAESWASMQFGAAVSSELDEDSAYTHLGAVSNFDIRALTVPGESVPVVIALPQEQKIPANAVWRKFINGQWQDFVVDAANSIDSAAVDINGSCPAVSSDVWQQGLTVGYGCIRLTIKDGGPNDNDAQSNGVVRDPGVLAVLNAVEPEPEPEVPGKDVKARSGGVMGAVFAGLLALLVAWRRRAATAALLLPCVASANGFYVGADAMAVSTDVKQAEVSSAVKVNNPDSTTTIDNKRRSGMRWYGGYAISNTWSVELAWLDLGSVDTAFGNLTAQSELNTLNTMIPLSGKGVEGSVVWQPWVYKDRIIPALRVGLWHMDTRNTFDVDDTSYRFNNSDNVLVVELSTGIVLSEQWQLKAGISHYDTNPYRTYTAQIGLQYKF